MSEEKLDCWSVRKGLWPPEQPRLAREWVVRARRHVEKCRACADYFEQDRRLLELYDRARSVSVPEGLRERVLTMLATERAGESSAHSRRVKPAPGESSTSPPGSERERQRARFLDFISWKRIAAVGLVAAVAGGLVLGTGPDGVLPTETSMFVEDYLRRAVSQDRISSSDPSEVSRFLARELGLGLVPLRVAGLELAGAEICLLEGRRGAMIRYRSEGEVVSHYLVPRGDSRIRPPTVTVPPADGTDPEVSPAVVVWSDARVEQALVARLPPERLLDLARVAVTQD